ncbi:TA2R7 protein, partial [Sapayoa aenigma]|nr:TA2R7 protein [Sapayoa aenigma]
SPQQSNVTSYGATAVAIITLEAFAGMWINAFVVSVLCMGWVKKKILNSNEKILLLLGCSRLCNLCISWIHFFLLIIYPNYLYVHPTFQLLVCIQSFLNYSDLWVSASLCVFYCVKIANFRNSCFIYLKVKIDRMVPGLLLGSVLVSLVLSIILYNEMDKALSKNLNYTCQGHIWKASIIREERFFANRFIVGLVFVTSFMVVIFSALLLLFSLWRHKRNMQTNCMKDLSMDAHIRAMKSILSFFIMYSINFIFLILSLIYYVKEENHMLILIAPVLHAFPGFHSLILICSNPKLEKTMLRVLPCVKCK